MTEVTKQEAATRQLLQAIRLLFDDGDMVGVHTLAGAAFQLFADLGSQSDIVSRFRSNELIRPERMKEWHRALNHTQNFLKHADRDPDEVLQYAPEGTILLLYEAVELGERVMSLEGREVLAFKWWFVASHPELVEPRLRAAIREVNGVGLDQTDKDLWAAWLRSGRPLGHQRGPSA